MEGHGGSGESFRRLCGDRALIWGGEVVDVREIGGIEVTRTEVVVGRYGRSKQFQILGLGVTSEDHYAVCIFAMLAVAKNAERLRFCIDLVDGDVVRNDSAFHSLMNQKRL